MRWTMPLMVGGLMAVFLPGCQSGERPAYSLVLSGSHTMTPLFIDIAQRFSDQHPDVRINVESTPGERAITDTRQGLADLGMLGRLLRTEENGLFAFPVARDGLAFIVHRDNKVRPLTDNEIVGVFTRTYQSWKELGGNDWPITLAGQGEARAAHQVFLDYFGLQPQQVRANPTVANSELAIQAVASHPPAIGYASLGQAEKAALALPIRLLPLEGVPATLDNVRNGRYSFVRPLQLLTREPPQGVIRDFLDFARSPEVHDLIQQHGFVPVARTDAKTP